MSNQYIKEERTADDLIRVLENPDNVVLYNMIKEYFEDFCDCDVRVWLIEQIENENGDVIDQIKELIAAPTALPGAPNLPAAKNPTGYLLSAACVAADWVGTFADGVGGATTNILVENSPECATVEWDVGMMLMPLNRQYHQNPDPLLLVPESFYEVDPSELNHVTSTGQNPGDPPGNYIPFMITGFPMIGGAADKGHITFDWYDFPSLYLEGVRINELLTTRQPCAAKGTIAYDELTGIGVVTWTAGYPPANAPRWTMLAISYQGQEIFSIQCIPLGPETPNQQIETFALSGMSEHNVLMRYPYTGYYTNFP